MRLLLAYGSPFLAATPSVGALVLAATLLDPAVGLLGLSAGLSALGVRALLRLPALPGEVEVLNAVYVGLVLGAFHSWNGPLVVLSALGGGLVVLLGSGLGPVLHRARDLPLLGAPFLLTAWTLLPAAKAPGDPAARPRPGRPLPVLDRVLANRGPLHRRGPPLRPQPALRRGAARGGAPRLPGAGAARALGRRARLGTGEPPPGGLRDPRSRCWRPSTAR